VPVARHANVVPDASCDDDNDDNDREHFHGFPPFVYAHAKYGAAVVEDKHDLGEDVHAGSRQGLEAQRAAAKSISSNFARSYLSRTFIATLDVAARFATLSLRMRARKLSSARSE
jgi:hypothetical protein